MRSSLKKDPGLHTGFAYFPEDAPYQKHILKYATQKDISTCSGFKTLANAETQFSAGLRSTGVGMCLCARHEIIRPGGVGDLQKGERYCNMDFVLLSALAPLLVASVFISYDIACQFKLGFETRMPKLPKGLHIPPDVQLDWGIPKCHCPMHKVPCQAPHSLNFKPGVGRTDGEGIERSWAEMNRVANSTKEMGPGSRHDTLDDHFEHHNFRKYVSLGRTLHSRLTLAIPEQKRQQAIFDDFCSSLKENGLEDKWLKMVLEWEKDPKKPNPYISVVTHASQTEVKKQLLEEEKRAVTAGVPQLHDTGPTGFISMGLVVEESQRRIIWDSRHSAELTTNQDNELQRRRLLLLRHVKQFRAVGDDDDAVLHEAVRIEWAKARARCLRWTEEVHLLKEEMRRVRKTLEWKASWWDARQPGWQALDKPMGEGVRAYASRQASIQRALHAQFTRLWDTPWTPILFISKAMTSKWRNKWEIRKTIRAPKWEIV
ncbi:uncharacterized protein LACBIDRAFT_336275 [Laccaria bicolor S238N-H82]|uniref:Predicted protein n=1 Tax=Laccaria bicolor (strain S238N-H82 / ATCC MYA-4686) TaxID=486041 RepID=B0E4Y6_LACBS|nr:uncharacterized protein LACBIDRAFT_336275 [Laccaria bicolor S238N-H82]EDQ98095.1 predicted protein [Laccaria bicolor S238N-H82]|eukprot:XP_001891254.1 predicted protein [Laccaria bicolor S238N-H82]